MCNVAVTIVHQQPVHRLPEKFAKFLHKQGLLSKMKKIVAAACHGSGNYLKSYGYLINVTVLFGMRSMEILPVLYQCVKNLFSFYSCPMKKFVFLLPVTLLLNIPYSANTQIRSGAFVLNGEVKGVNNHWIFLSYINNEKVSTYDSTQVQNGKFFFTGSIPGPTLAAISLKNTGNNKNYTEFWLEPGKLEMSVVLNEFENARILGSATQNDFSHFNRIRERVKKKYTSQLDSLKGLKNMEQIAAIRNRLKPFFDEIEQRELHYFNTHPRSYITAYWLRFYVPTMPLDTLKAYYHRLGGQLQSSVYGAYIADKIKQLSGGSPGSKANVFVTKDLKGNNIDLAGFKGSYVLLEFWASWCIPCRKEHPQLIELYSRYHQKKVEFIGVADDDEAQDAWIKAINKDQLPWIQVLRGRKSDTATNKTKNDINGLFGIQSLPTLILINPEGIIIGRYEENVEDLKNDLRKNIGF
jgi:thiol-disulfide isomerase/thioredoxin